MKISTKLILSFSLVSCLVFVVGYVSLSVAKNTQTQYTAVIEEHLPVIHMAKDVGFQGMRMLMTINELGFIHAESKSKELSQIYEEEVSELRERVIPPFLDTLQDYEIGMAKLFPDEIGYVENIKKSSAEILSISNELLELYNQGIAGNKLLSVRATLEEAKNKFLQAIDDATHHEHVELQKKQSLVAQTIESGFVKVNIASVVVFSLGMFFSLLISRLLSKPICALANAATEIGKGHLDTKVKINSSDEFGKLATAFNKMGSALSETTVSINYIENILASMGESLLVLDQGGKILKVNQASTALFGYSCDELIGKKFTELFAPDMNSANPCLGFKDRQTLCGCEANCITKDGREIPVHFSSALLFDTDKNVMGAAYLGRDISEHLQAKENLQRKNQELERSNQELDQFAYVVSHDLKAPLRAISNLAEWIEEDLEDKLEEDTQNNMKLLHARVKRMEALINGVLEYSRIGRSEQNVREVDVQKLLSEVIDSMPVPKDFKINISSTMPVVTACKVRMGQVFSNLVSNAIKYRRDQDGQVDINVSDEGDYYRFSVADNGPGIAPEYHDKVFIIFQTLNAKDKKESTGVGLTLVKKIIEDQGGQISVKSEEGQGAIFFFTWPKYIKEEDTQ